MSNWLNIPVKERIELLREYNKLGYSYSSAKKDFEGSLQKLQKGGLLENPSSILVAQEIPQNNLGMTGMMKGTIAREAHFGNPAAQRMISSNPKTGMTPEGQGTHYMGSYGKYAIPKLQDTGQDSLQYYPNKPPLTEAIKFNTEKEAEYFAENYKDIAPMMRNLPKYEDGGTLTPQSPKKKVVVFAEAPIRNFYQEEDSDLPESLRNLSIVVKEKREKTVENEKELETYKNYLINYLKGYTGKDIEDVDIGSYKINNSNWVSNKETLDLLQFRKYKELSEKKNKLFKEFNEAENNFLEASRNIPTPPGSRHETFITEAENVKNFYKDKNVDVQIFPTYNNLSQVDSLYKTLSPQDEVLIFGHAGSDLGGISLEDWNNLINKNAPENCYIGACNFDLHADHFNTNKNLYITPESRRWHGFNSRSKDFKEGMFSREGEQIIVPEEGKDFINIKTPPQLGQGGVIPIEPLKRRRR